MINKINSNTTTTVNNIVTILDNQGAAATQAATDVTAIKGDIGAVKTVVENNANNIDAVRTIVDNNAIDNDMILDNQQNAKNQAATDVAAIKADIAGISSGGTNYKLTGLTDPAVFADIQRNTQPSGMTTNLYTALKTLHDRGLIVHWSGVPTIYSGSAVEYLNLKLTGYEPNEIANKIPDDTFIGKNTTIGDIKTYLDEIVSSGYWSLSAS